MGVYTSEFEIVSAIPPAKMFLALVLDDKLIPKIVPNIKSVEILEGDGGPGSIKKFTFADGINYMKHRVDSLDKDNHTYCYSVIEGDALKNALEKISFENKMEPLPDGGSICKCTSKYYTIGDLEIKNEEINAGNEKAAGLFKAVEAYLLANPDA